MYATRPCHPPPIATPEKSAGETMLKFLFLFGKEVEAT
jgi:hypothetical protein